MTVIKRDGREVPFDEQKINAALIKAEKKIHGSLSPITYEKIQSIAELVIKEIKDRFANNVKIYEIQNIVEHILLEKTNMP
ncbi:ATP cone domain-containing protein [Enterococcus mundtii]|nr:ATP cone domain-containing protein [Enterococcus mundtii]